MVKVCHWCFPDGDHAIVFRNKQNRRRQGSQLYEIIRILRSLDDTNKSTLEKTFQVTQTLTWTRTLIKLYFNNNLVGKSYRKDIEKSLTA